jgi:hypothetical protein
MRSANVLSKKENKTPTFAFVGSFLKLKALSAKRQKLLHQRLKQKEKKIRINTAYSED